MSNISDDPEQMDRRAEVMAAAELAVRDFVLKWAPSDPVRFQQFMAQLQELTTIQMELGGIAATEVILSIIETKRTSDRPS